MSLPASQATAWRLPAPSLAMAFSAALALVLAQAQRVAHARRLSGKAPPAFTRPHQAPRRRVLLVGDSTGAGVGCDDPNESLAAHLSRDFESADVRNLCFNGATVDDVLRTVAALSEGERFDLVLVFAGGNDVLQHTPWLELRATTARLLDKLRRRGGRVLWVGMANVGLAPLFLPPFSWWMTSRTRRANRLLAAQVQAAGGQFIDFFRERGTCPFSAEPGLYYARDGVHPSARAYARCYAEMRPSIAQVLAD